MNIGDLRIKCLTDFKVAVLSELGGYFNKIELTDGNWLSIIRNCVAYFRAYDSGACTRRTFVKIMLTKDVREYNMRDFNISNIVKIMGHETNFYSEFLQAMMMNGVNGMGSWVSIGSNNLTSDLLHNLNDYIINYTNMREVEKFFRKKILFTFEKENSILTLTTTPMQDMPVLIDCFMLNDLIDCFNNYLFRKLAIAHAKIQWAKNLEGKIKIDFPHGEVMIHDVLAEGKEELIKYEDEIRDYKNHALFHRT